MILVNICLYLNIYYYVKINFAFLYKLFEANRNRKVEKVKKSITTTITII